MKYFYKFIFLLFLSFSFLFFTFKTFAAFDDKNIIFIGFKLDPILVQNKYSSLIITYQNNSQEDFLGTVSIVCSKSSPKKIAEDKSILISKNSQENVILNVRTSYTEKSLECGISIKDRSDLMVNNNIINLQVLENVNLNSLNNDVNINNDEGEIGSSTSLYIRGQGVYNNILNKFNSIFNQKSSSSTEIYDLKNLNIDDSDIILKIDKYINNFADSSSSSEISKVNIKAKDESLMNNQNDDLDKNQNSQNLKSYYDFSKEENIFSKLGLFFNGFLKEHFDNKNAFGNMFIALSDFIFNMLSQVYNILSASIVKIFSYLLPDFMSIFIAKYWL
jgi:hypothetical protein